MKLIDRAYVEANKAEIIEAIKNGKIFIYPTDTIYGLGTNALLDDSVKKIREIKKRDTKAFSVIAPNKNWILENCEVSREELDKYLPGPYTLFLNRNRTCVSGEVNSNDDSLGVRIPKYWFTEIITEALIPFITTSVNVAGEEQMKELKDVSREILDQVDYIVYEGENNGKPSQKINLI